VTGACRIKIRRVGERRTWPFGRLRAEYEIVNVDEQQNVYKTTTIVPSAVLVARGNVHTTDSWDWILAADHAYTPHQESWVCITGWGSSSL
jgi:hypothetical protein